MEGEDLVVEILPEDFKNAPHGYHGTDCCVLWQALHRVKPESSIHVGFRSVRMDGKEYRIDCQEWGGDQPGMKIPIWTINELSDKAKESLEGIPTVSLTLEHTD